MSKPNKGKISNWTIIPFGANNRFIVIGDHESGTDIRTSWIVRIDFEKGEVETRNSIYSLSDQGQCKELS